MSVFSAYSRYYDLLYRDKDYAGEEQKRSSLAPELAHRLRFKQGDARTVRLGERADAVISLFHVMSYQTSNADLTAAFATAREHLAEGGVFIFDCWYGPAVLTERPAVRVKRLEDVETSVTRIAEPVMNAAENTVDVNYTVLVHGRNSAANPILRETHRMRYLFGPEIEQLLAAGGMSLVASHEWMSTAAPGLHSWSACFIARAVNAG